MRQRQSTAAATEAIRLALRLTKRVLPPQRPRSARVAVYAIGSLTVRRPSSDAVSRDGDRLADLVDRHAPVVLDCGRSDRHVGPVDSCTAARAVNTARTQCWQVIPSTATVVIMRETISADDMFWRMNVAFLGLGAIGRPMAARLAGRACPLAVWNRTAARAARFARETGARLAATPADAARDADVVITCLPDSPDVESLLDGDDGLLAGHRRGAHCSSTARPATRRRRAGSPRVSPSAASASSTRR